MHFEPHGTTAHLRAEPISNANTSFVFPSPPSKRWFTVSGLLQIFYDNSIEVPSETHIYNAIFVRHRTDSNTKQQKGQMAACLPPPWKTNSDQIGFNIRVAEKKGERISNLSIRIGYYIVRGNTPTIRHHSPKRAQPITTRPKYHRPPKAHRRQIYL